MATTAMKSPGGGLATTSGRAISVSASAYATSTDAPRATKVAQEAAETIGADGKAVVAGCGMLKRRMVRQLQRDAAEALTTTSTGADTPVPSSEPAAAWLFVRPALGLAAITTCVAATLVVLETSVTETTTWTSKRTTVLRTYRQHLGGRIRHLCLA